MNDDFKNYIQLGIRYNVSYHARCELTGKSTLLAWMGCGNSYTNRRQENEPPVENSTSYFEYRYPQPLQLNPDTKSIYFGQRPDGCSHIYIDYVQFIQLDPPSAGVTPTPLPKYKEEILEPMNFVWEEPIENPNSGLEGGEIAAIVIGAMTFVAIVTIAIFIVLQRNKRNDSSEDKTESNLKIM